MPTPTTTYAFDKPTVGGDDNAWGSSLNSNLDKLDDLLDGTLSITPNLGTGWEVGGVAVTASAAELNILDGVTASTAEINYVDGVTSAIQTQIDGKQALDADLTAIAGLSSNGIVARTGAGTAEVRTVTAGTGIAVTDGDGVSGNPTVAASIASQVEAEAGTATDKLMTPERTKQAIDALASAESMTLLGTLTTTSGTTQTLSGLNLTPYKHLVCVVDKVRCSSGARRLRLDGRVVSDESGSSSDLFSGIVEVSLVTGVCIGVVAQGSTSEFNTGLSISSIVSTVTYTTASTSIVFTWNGSGDFNLGSILVYGVK
jgi:hypothetical protein